MTARFDEKTSTPYLDFSQTIVCDLDTMLKRNAISSVSRFLEDVFRFGETSQSSEVFDFSDLKFVEVSKKTLWEWFLTKLRVKDYVDRVEPFAIRDISKAAR